MHSIPIQIATLDSAWFSIGAGIKQKALDVALKIAA